MSTKLTAEQSRDIQRTMQLARYRAMQVDAGNLPPPDITSETIGDDKLLPLNVLDSGLNFSVLKWGVAANDTVQIFWNGQHISELDHDIPDPDTEKFPIAFTLDSKYLKNDGTYSLTYQVERASGKTTDSDPTTIKIDTRPPNYGNPPVLQFPDDVINNGLTPDYLNKHDGLDATVPRYQGMETGQSVQLYWNSTPVDPVTITTGVDTKIHIPKDTIVAGGNGEKQAYCHLVSRAGVVGHDSEPPVAITVALDPVPANLKAPTVPLADPVVDLDDATAGVSIFISQYDNFQATDLVLAKWGNTSLPAVPVENSFTTPPNKVEVKVPRGVVVNEGSGDISVSYQIQRGTLSYSAPPLSVTVDVSHAGPPDPDPDTPVNENLAAPIVKGASGQSNKLGPADDNNPASVTVPYYGDIQGAIIEAGDIIRVYWGVPPTQTPLNPYTLTQDDISNKNIPDFTVDANVVHATPDGNDWEVYYTVGRPITTPPENPSLSSSQTIDVAMRTPTNLDPAVFPDANKRGWLVTATVTSGARVHVKPYNNMKIGDQVTLNWQAYKTTNAASGDEISGTSYQSPTLTVDSQSQLSNGLDFLVPYQIYIEPIATAAKYGQGSGKAYYTILQNGQSYNSPDAVAPIDLGSST
ncbi:hypothetical protein [Burkholderia ubonensis]|uniref:hypothetical protein n=1 Tax=Burkholderia ubonensis TaxID=101571 RepID=UPI000B1E5F38|nr:hypothetical protein [Burkholderia ubonensis]